MWKIKDEIRRVAKSLNINEVPVAEAEHFRNEVMRKFTHGESNGALWEHVKDAVSLQDPDGWRLTTEFIDDASALMFFNKSEEKTMFEFENGSDVKSVLQATHHFEFYLTNRQTDYLLVFNHHDFLIAVGTAAQWLRGLLGRNMSE